MARSTRRATHSKPTGPPLASSAGNAVIVNVQLMSVLKTRISPKRRKRTRLHDIRMPADPAVVIADHVMGTPTVAKATRARHDRNAPLSLEPRRAICHTKCE